MDTKLKSYDTKFGKFIPDNSPDGLFFWELQISVECAIFSGVVPVSVLSAVEEISDNTLKLAEKIVANMNEYLEKGIYFIAKTLKENPGLYYIKETELTYLSYDVKTFPLDLPELTFYNNKDDEWLIRFAEGKFDICDPFGISVVFKSLKPHEIMNLENSTEFD